MNFPIVDNAPTTPEPSLCTHCSTIMPSDGSDIWLTLGALVGDSDKASMGNVGELFGFLSINKHMGRSLDIVVNSTAGQADIGFCSTKCLRAFFNGCVDKLEKA